MKRYIITEPEKCSLCLSCVRNCPVHANKVYEKEGYVEPLLELCIACGDCIKHCPENARRYIHEGELLYEWSKRGKKVIAIVAPAYISHFVGIPPTKLCSALKKVGFTQVWEVAVGAEFTTLAAIECLQKYPSKKFITSPCPSIVNYIKKWLPQLHDYLMPVDSPMMALGRYLKKKYPDSSVVFIGPCIAKKSEIEDPNVKGIVDLVLTFEEIEEIFAEKKLNLESMKDELLDGFQPYYGTSYPISGGLMRTASFYMKDLADPVLDTDILIIEGKERVVSYLKAYLKNIQEGKESLNPKIVDILYCEGCIDGPAVRRDLTVPEKRHLVAKYTKSRMVVKSMFGVKAGQQVAKKLLSVSQVRREYASIDAFRAFKREPVRMKTPSVQEIEEVLKRTNRLNNELNCGACGFESCRERAVAVLNGLVPLEMCVQYQKERAEELFNEVREKNDHIREIVASVVGALEDIKRTSNGMVIAVDSLGQNSSAIHEASQTGQIVVKNLAGIRDEILNFNRTMNEAVEEVSREVAHLSEIVDMIANISDQTNLLALNAAVESARLGESSRAFAVIASEIRELAVESEESLDGIRDLVNSILRNFDKLKEKSRTLEKVGENTTTAAESVLREFDNIRKLLETTGSTIEEVTASIEEVKAGIDDISSSVEKALNVG